MYDAIDGPLTDYSYSDVEDDGNQSLGKRRKDNPSKTRVRKRERKRLYRTRKRMEVQAKEGTRVKAVAKALRLKAVQNALLFDFNVLTDAGVTLPAWVGKSVKDMPKQVFTKDELMDKYNMTLFEWDGMYVVPALPAWWILIAGLACRTSCLIRSTGSSAFLLASHVCGKVGRPSMTTPWWPSGQLGPG